MLNLRFHDRCVGNTCNPEPALPVRMVFSLASLIIIGAFGQQAVRAANEFRTSSLEDVMDSCMLGVMFEKGMKPTIDRYLAHDREQALFCAMLAAITIAIAQYFIH